MPHWRSCEATSRCASSTWQPASVASRQRRPARIAAAPYAPSSGTALSRRYAALEKLRGYLSLRELDLAARVGRIAPEEARQDRRRPIRAELGDRVEPAVCRTGEAARLPLAARARPGSPRRSHRARGGPPGSPPPHTRRARGPR